MSRQDELPQPVESLISPKIGDKRPLYGSNLTSGNQNLFNIGASSNAFQKKGSNDSQMMHRGRL